jgi:histone H3/H4
VIAATNAWKRCSTCKDPIGFDARYYLCSVSTCNRKRMTLVFCSVPCWDAHQADARHRDAGAEEARSPNAAEWAKEVAQEKEKTSAKNAMPGPVEMQRVTGAASLDILVIGAKLKDYIRARAQMSTSDRCLGFLSDHLRKLSDRAIEAAGKDGRRTVMDRDVTPLVTRGLESLATGAGDPDDRVDDVLVVTSKLKAYVKARAGMNTSDSVPVVLSAHVRRLARQAIRNAGTDDRKTVLDRDFAQALSRDKG